MSRDSTDLDVLKEARRRLEARRVINDEGCWLYPTGGSYDGYVLMRLAGRAMGVHRWAWLIWKGSVPDGMELHHLCHERAGCQAGTDCQHRRCFNPDHLMPMSHADNNARVSRRLMMGSWCNHGHRYTPDNIVPRRLSSGGDGFRCRACREATMLRRRQRQRAARAHDRARQGTREDTATGEAGPTAP